MSLPTLVILGGGGTTWRGTLTKLLLPGALFHHETATKDWFFDLMKPWIHYVPVSWNLNDLRVRYEWAEANPEETKNIAKMGQILGLSLLSEMYMNQTYQQLFVDYLGDVVNAYQPLLHNDGQTVLDWEALQHHYAQNGYTMFLVSSCDKRECFTEMANNVTVPVRHVPVQQPLEQQQQEYARRREAQQQQHLEHQYARQ